MASADDAEPGWVAAARTVSGVLRETIVVLESHRAASAAKVEDAERACITTKMACMEAQRMCHVSAFRGKTEDETKRAREAWDDADEAADAAARTASDAVKRARLTDVVSETLAAVLAVPLATMETALATRTPSSETPSSPLPPPPTEPSVVAAAAESTPPPPPPAAAPPPPPPPPDTQSILEAAARETPGPCSASGSLYFVPEIAAIYGAVKEWVRLHPHTLYGTNGHARFLSPSLSPCECDDCVLPPPVFIEESRGCVFHEGPHVRGVVSAVDPRSSTVYRAFASARSAQVTRLGGGSSASAPSLPSLAPATEEEDAAFRAAQALAAPWRCVACELLNSGDATQLLTPRGDDAAWTEWLRATSRRDSALHAFRSHRTLALWDETLVFEWPPAFQWGQQAPAFLNWSVAAQADLLVFTLPLFVSVRARKVYFGSEEAQHRAYYATHVAVEALEGAAERRKLVVESDGWSNSAAYGSPPPRLPPPSPPPSPPPPPPPSIVAECPLSSDDAENEGTGATSSYDAREAAAAAQTAATEAVRCRPPLTARIANLVSKMQGLAMAEQLNVVRLLFPHDPRVASSSSSREGSSGVESDGEQHLYSEVEIATSGGLAAAEDFVASVTTRRRRKEGGGAGGKGPVG